MKYVLSVVAFVLFSFTILSSSQWETDFQKAKEAAFAQHKFILLNFSGSDWCGPCIRLRKEVFDNTTFTTFAKDNLILVNADFPRQKKNQLPKAQQEKNDQLADKYNTAGSFPLTVLLDANGKVIKSWNGFYKNGVPDFINELKEAMHVSN